MRKQCYKYFQNLETCCSKNEAYRRIIAIFVNWHNYKCIYIPSEMYQFTKVTMTGSVNWYVRPQNVSYCTQRNLYEILLNQTKIRLYLPCNDSFGTANGRCPFVVTNQSVISKHNLISVWFNEIWKIFLCV